MSDTWGGCDIDECPNDAIDNIAGVIWYCEEHRDEALEAYRDWKEDI